ncbi:hypothetical protein [Clostridium sp. LIBA-8841]|uniref:hypothetical protein n=1 Tax=Clostridium sp. LIBA-8841 TaxID=2987530 RepID=UPI002AC7BEAC|nr:hypothetical protein [Clostridium sp. LIBA-8841]MDZ5255347.1 hypothetical protein [Clostridium sp. LIBA-8841]
MGKKILVGILSATLSLFILGCGSVGVEKNVTNSPVEKRSEEEKQKSKEEYIDKLSSTIVNISVDGSINNMRTISETGELNDIMIEELNKSNNFFQSLVDDFTSLNVPEEFVSYNDDILNSLNDAKSSLEVLKNSENKEDIKNNANKFIQSNKEISHIIDKVLLYYAGC